MRQKSTIYGGEFHNQFHESEEMIRRQKEDRAEHSQRDEKQGQSDFWIKKETDKKGQQRRYN